MGKKGLIYGRAIILTLGLYVLVQLLLALLAVRGILPESSVFPAQVIVCALSVLIGSLYTVRRSNLGTLYASLLASGGFAALLLLVGLLAYNQIDWTGQGKIFLLAILGSGILAGILGTKGRRKHKKNRKK